MHLEKTNNKAIKVLQDLEHTNLATFHYDKTELITIDGEEFFAKSFSCHNLEIILNGRQITLNGYGTPAKPIATNIVSGELWLFYNTRKCLLYDNTYKEILGELEKIIDPRNLSERIKDLEL